MIVPETLTVVPETLTVLYDADCGVCGWTARLLHWLDRHHRLRLIPLASASLRGQPSQDALREALHAVDSEGQWRAGADACVEIAARLPVLRPLAWLAAIPRSRPLIDAGYRLVAGNRHRLSAMLGLKACAAGPAGATGGDGRPRS